MPRRPDFDRLRTTLYGGRADAVPLAELFHDLEVMDHFMGAEVNTTAEMVQFYVCAGYDYVPVGHGRWFSGVLSPEKEIAGSRAFRERRRSRRLFSESETERRLIASREEFERYDWSRHLWLQGGGDLSYLDQVAALMPAGMKLIAWSDGIYEFFPKNIGYERFCYALNDDPAFVQAVLDEVGRRAVAAYARVAAHPAVGAIWLADDLGYTEGLLWSPALMRRYLFPWYSKLGEIARAHAMPLIFHSDGRLWEIVPDLIAAGVNALQPIEPKAWDAAEVKRRYGDRLCIMGTMDLDLLCRGTTAQVAEMVRRHIDLLGRDGGLVIGSSNTPTYYMNQDNYRAMLQTALEYGGVC